MQVVLIMGIFGAVYAAIVGLTIGMSLNAMQQNELLKEEVSQVLSDIEYGITNGYLDENVDLRTVYNVGIPHIDNLDFILEYVKWSKDELTNDPWKTPYLIKAFANKETVYADGAGSLVEAPLVAFLIVSYGPDRTADFNYNGENNYNKVTGFDVQDVAITDDIIRVFTTRKAMLKHWNEAKEFVDSVGAVAAIDYKQQYAMFKDDIALFYTSNEIDLLDGAGEIIQEAVNSWRAPYIDPVTLVVNPVINFSTSGYPKMNNSSLLLGLDEAYDKLPVNFKTGLSFDLSASGTNEIVDIDFSHNDDNDADTWNIVYKIRVDGSANDF